MPKPTWTDDDLIAAIGASSSIAQIGRLLGLRSTNYRTIKSHVARLGVDASHIPSLVEARSRRPRSWTDADLATAVADSRSFAEVMRRLGYEPSGGVHRWLRSHIDALDLSTAHFSGQAWARGSRRKRFARPLQEIMTINSTYNSGTLRKRLIKEGLKQARCEGCGLTEWRGVMLPLALDHINGDGRDNRLENLRILCPNCHAITPTWCARKPRPA